MRARGWCTKHYQRWSNHGDPTYTERERTPSQRFWAKVEIVEGGCWEWQGWRNQFGYGRFRPLDGGKHMMAHRFSYRDRVGDIPAGKVICHTCDNPPCVRPDHLWVGTQADNAADAVAKGRHVRDVAPGSYATGEAHGNSKLTEDDVREMRRLRQDGWVYARLGNRFGVQTMTARSACLGITWAHVT